MTLRSFPTSRARVPFPKRTEWPVPRLATPAQEQAVCPLQARYPMGPSLSVGQPWVLPARSPVTPLSVEANGRGVAQMMLRKRTYAGCVHVVTSR
jgi:hypothetical protein